MLKDADIRIEAAIATDIDFAENLVRSNMRPYFDHYRIQWEPQNFYDGWSTYENSIIKKDNIAVGLLSVLVENDTRLYLCDIQLLPEYQSQGIGGLILKKLDAQANKRKLAGIRLRVFRTNPAKNLYLRHGYRIVLEEKNTLAMEKRLKNNAY